MATATTGEYSASRVFLSYSRSDGVRVRGLVALLEALGHTDRTRIHGPLGLDLGSRTPAETAVAMAAEFLAVRRGRPPRSLSEHDGPIHA